MKRTIDNQTFNINGELITSYKNGNYTVELYDDGTKIRFGEEPFKPEFPESMDVCITKCCDGGCPFCYENCTIDGKHGTILLRNGDDISLPYWMQNLHPGTELAMNGNDLSHPDLFDCLRLLKDNGVIVNLTVNQKHFEKHWESLYLMQMADLIHGIGISIEDSSSESLHKLIGLFDNVVLHTIAGILTVEDIINLQALKPKILILGYKNVGRGIKYKKQFEESINSNIEELKLNLKLMQQYFDVISFDNLALNQLDVKNVLFNNDEEKWSKFYMGDDGGFTMYIDTVSGKYSKNSCVPYKERYKITKRMTVEDMFNDIKQKYA